MIRIFEHPVNCMREKVDVDTSVCAFFFGPIYLALKRQWLHACMWLVIVVPVAYMFGHVWLFLTVPIAALVYAVQIQPILIHSYLRRGWTEVTEKISTPYEILQAKLYVDSINSTYTSIPTVQPIPTTRACHFCTAEVSMDAVTCHHCHSDLSTQMANV